MRSFEYVQLFKTISSLSKVELELSSHTFTTHERGIILEFSLKSHLNNFILTINRCTTLQIVTNRTLWIMFGSNQIMKLLFTSTSSYTRRNHYFTFFLKTSRRKDNRRIVFTFEAPTNSHQAHHDC